MYVGVGWWWGVTLATASPRSPSLLFILIISHPIHTKDSFAKERQQARHSYAQVPILPGTLLPPAWDASCVHPSTWFYSWPPFIKRLSVPSLQTKPDRCSEEGRRLQVLRGAPSREGTKHHRRTQEKREAVCNPRHPLQTRRKTGAALETRADPLFLAESCYFLLSAFRQDFTFASRLQDPEPQGLILLAE